MRFAFTDDQIGFRDAVRDLLAHECPASVVRAAWDNADGRSGAAWSALAEMGVLGVAAPESAGGLGLTMLDLVLIAEETGYAALPEPFVEHAMVAVPALPDATVAAAVIDRLAHHSEVIIIEGKSFRLPPGQEPLAD
jgi:alkylation response protein AidB-like acyl-CoA dehydrogenase